MGPTLSHHQIQKKEKDKDGKDEDGMKYVPPDCPFYNDIRDSEPELAASFQQRIPHRPWKRKYNSGEFITNLDKQDDSVRSHGPGQQESGSCSRAETDPEGDLWISSLKDDRQARRTAAAVVDLRSLPVAPWCGTDLVSHPKDFFRPNSGQAHEEDTRHSREMGWSLEEQWEHTRTVPVLPVWLEHGRDLKEDRYRVPGMQPFNLQDPRKGQGQHPGVVSGRVPIRNTGPRLVDFFVDAEDLVCPPLRLEYARIVSERKADEDERLKRLWEGDDPENKGTLTTIACVVHKFLKQFQL